MAININTDVLIVGAGPTGLTLACTLARYGVDILMKQIIDTVPKANVYIL